MLWLLEVAMTLAAIGIFLLFMFSSPTALIFVLWVTAMGLILAHNLRKKARDGR
jgi:ABC-type iron transport system FetAB permease component